MRASAVPVTALALATMLALAPSTSRAAQPADAHALALGMDRAGHTAGTRVRATLSAIAPTPDGEGGAAPAPLARITLRARADAGRRTLRLDASSGGGTRTVLLASGPDGALQATAPDGSPVDASAPMVEGVLAPIDLSGAWWRWSAQRIAGRGRVLGRDCTLLESSRPAARGEAPSAIRRVRSCVAEGVHVPLRVELFGSGGEALRRVEALRLQRLDDGRQVAASVLLQRAGDAALRLDAYAVDTDRRGSGDTP